MASRDGEVGSIDRRRFVIGAAGAVAVACVVGSLDGEVGASGRARRGVPPPPAPIPGGQPVPVPGIDMIHVWGPGPAGLELPYSKGILQGLEFEPSTITDFNGSSALAYHVGTAVGSDGQMYNLETDMRAFEGDYVVDGEERHGAFALV
jgi:hypothetical protein